MSDEILNYLIKLAPAFQEALPLNAMFGITDTEKFLLYLPAPNLNLGDIKGMQIPEGDAIYKAIHTQRTQTMTVPKEAFGIAFRAKGIPIKDANGNVIGGLGIGISLESQGKLNEMASHFTSTSEEVAASTQEMSTAATELVNSMEYLNQLQAEMKEQVQSTENMLDFINSIANNSRILSLNAGIEAVRAGEFGKGFGVVAQEIKKLAENSSKSVNEIRDKINSLKKKVENIAETVQKVNEIARQQSHATGEISSAINDLATAAADFEELSKLI